MKKFLLIFFVFTTAFCFATHNRAGEILYKRIAPFTQVVGGVTVPVFTYSITIITYTDDGSGIADRCEDTVYFGDGQRGIAPRINGGAGCSGCNHCGVLIVNESGYKVKLNTYTITHTYSGAGSYTIQMFDPNRNHDVDNIPNSDQQPFYIESLLIINNFSGANTSPEFHNPPIDRACTNKCFYHNPAAFDVDGDSLSFEITTSRGLGGQTVPGYSFPDPGVGGSYDINAVTGLLRWCSPQITGQFNIAFIVKEWRKNTSGIYKLIGSVLRDMQVIVVQCPNNFPPVVTVPPDTCVEAGSLITKKIYVTDNTTSTNNQVTLTGAGGAFAATSPVAVLSNPPLYTPFSVDFSWQTSCDHVRAQVYQTVFKAQDHGNSGIPSSPLVSFSTYNIKVVPPSVKNVTAVPVGSTIKVSWTQSNCNPAGNPLTGYKIYRKNDCTPFVYNPCLTGVDPASGFIQIGQTSTSTFSLSDNNNGNGLVVGQNYSYLVVAVYADGTESYGSSQVCAKLKRDIPVLLNVDIQSTSANNGAVYIRWSKPLVNAGNLDTNVYPGPYQFNVRYRSGTSGNFVTVKNITNLYFRGLDTIFIHSGINTQDSILYYSIEFIAGNTTIGASPLASSIFLKTTPGDREIKLNWISNTPWNNYKYTIYRSYATTASFTPIATTSQNEYTDTNHVVNRATYCYKVLGEGKYSDPSIFKPLMNFSQEICATARDLTIPCTPTLSIDADCPVGNATIRWTNVRPICSDDVLHYVLFYKKLVSDSYQRVDTFPLNRTSYTVDDPAIFSGCYAIQSVDSSGNASVLSPDFCIDNCPEFELPNIFSPNNDKANDFFKAIKVRQVKEIDLTIFDRWGNLVYKTKDPYFQWDGISILSKAEVSEGTFFYICEVFEPRLTGLRTRSLKGYLEVVR